MYAANTRKYIFRVYVLSYRKNDYIFLIGITLIRLKVPESDNKLLKWAVAYYVNSLFNNIVISDLSNIVKYHLSHKEDIFNALLKWAVAYYVNSLFNNIVISDLSSIVNYHLLHKEDIFNTLLKSFVKLYSYQSQD